MHPVCPTISPTAILTDDEFLAARLSSALARRGSYVAVIDGPRMTRDDRAAEVTRRNNGLARIRPKETLFAGLSPEGLAAMLEQLPKGHPRQVADDDVARSVNNPRVAANDPLRWGREHIGIGLLKALYEERLIEFTNSPSPAESIKSPAGHMVICEAGEPLSEVIAANYAFSLNAGLLMIEPPSETERKELLEAYYSINEPGTNQAEVRDKLQARLRELCNGLELPEGGSLTFITSGLPYGAAFPELPSTHLFHYPDLGIAVVNGFAAEQKHTRGTNVAVVVDPGKVRAPEIEAAIKLLPERSIFLRAYRNGWATVRHVSDMVDHYPYDLLIFATHCGDASGHRWTYNYNDREGINRTLVVDIAIGVANTDDPEMLHVSQFMRFVSLDEVDWTDPIAKKDLYVGTAIRDFMDQRDALEPVHKDTVRRVIGSSAMAMADNNYIAIPRSLAGQGSPIIINNACVSWHELAARFTFSNARAYIGTLYEVSDMEADEIVTKLLDKFYGKPLPHAVWSAQNAVYGAGGDRRPYVVTGVYPQRLRATKENVPRWLMHRLQSSLRAWRSRLETVPADDARMRKDIGSSIAYLELELRLSRRNWFDKMRASVLTRRAQTRRNGD